MDDRFRKAEQEFFALKGQVAAGRITSDQFDTALKQLMFQDKQGKWWMIGADTGKWYVHDGQNWVPANPVSIDAPASAPSFAIPPPGSAPQKIHGSRMPLLLSASGILLCCLVGVIGFIIASRAGIIKIGLSNPTPTTFFIPLPVTIPSITPVLRPTDLPPSNPATTPDLPILIPTPTITPTVAVVPTLTTIPPSPTIPIPSGLYVTGVRTEPSPLGERMDAGFIATFLNTTGAPQRYRWLVYVYKADNFRNSFGETASEVFDIPVGTSERKTFGTWRIGVGTCGDYVARVAWQDESKRPTFFNKPDGPLFEFSFKVCP